MVITLFIKKVGVVRPNLGGVWTLRPPSGCALARDTHWRQFESFEFELRFYVVQLDRKMGRFGDVHLSHSLG